MNEIKVLLACNMGMSTSMLIKKMLAAAEGLGVKATVEAQTVDRIVDVYQDFDVVLIGPQVSYKLNQVKEETEGKIPVGVIDMSAYGLMDGKKVLSQAISLAEGR